MEELLNHYGGLYACGLGCCGFCFFGDLIDHPQVAGAAGVAVVFTEMIKLLILPDIAQAVIEEVAHFSIGQETAGGSHRLHG